MKYRHLLASFLLLAIFLPLQSAGTEYSIPANRSFEVLTKPQSSNDYKRLLREAGNKLGQKNFFLAGNWINGEKLVRIASLRQNEPILRTVREELHQPVDLQDFALFLDDLILAYQEGKISRTPYVPSGRARTAGILLHTDDIFKNNARLYGKYSDHLFINTPKRQENLKAARSGDQLGPRWTKWYQNPGSEKERMAALERKCPDKTFVPRINHLLQQFRAQGAYVHISSTVRSRKRGYLMWGAFALGRCTTKEETDALVKKLIRLNKERNLNIPIKWSHPHGWNATVTAARDMTEAYDVVYATEKGAFHSNHYDATAIDVAVRSLPRKLVLKSPDGVVASFDLSDEDEPRDLSLTPRMIDWIEKHYGFKKLRTDYPHWDN